VARLGAPETDTEVRFAQCFGNSRVSCAINVSARGAGDSGSIDAPFLRASRTATIPKT
jgi:hypothetical protein